MSLYEAALQGDVEQIGALLRKRHKVDTAHKDFTMLGERIVAIRNGTPLMAAVGQGHREAAEFLLDHGADINRCEEGRYTALMLAAMLGHVDVLDLLIDRGADLNACDKNGGTALHCALMMQQLDCAERLVRAGADLNVADNYLKPVLHLAIEQWKYAAAKESPEHLERLAKLLKESVAELEKEATQKKTRLSNLIDLLLDSGAELHGRGLVGATPLHVAAEADEIEIARRLIGRGADVNRLDDYGNSPLTGAVKNVEMTRFLIRAGADPNAGTPGSARPLHFAVSREQEEVVVELLKAGADAAAKTGQGETPMSLAAEKALGDLVRVMIQLGAEDDSGEAAETLRDESLKQAAKTGDAAQVKKLLKEGADPNFVGKDGTRPFFNAAAEGHADVVKLFLDAGARVATTDHYQRTALHLAAESGNVEAIKLLLQAGADVNAVGEDCSDGYKGWTPLIAACRGGHSAAAAVLLKAGADANAMTDYKLTPLLLAVAASNRKLVEQLLKAGAKRDDIAEHFLESLEFADRLKEAKYKKAVADLSKLCCVKPVTKSRFKDGAMFDLSRSPRTAKLVPKVMEALIRPVVERGEKSEKEARKMFKSFAADRARERAVHEILEERRQEFLDRGCLLVYSELLIGDMLVLLPTLDQLAAVACLGPWAGGAPRILSYLQSLADDEKYEVYGCSHATLMLQFTGKIRDKTALAKRLFRLGSHERGVIENGETRLTDTIKELAAALSKRRPIVRLWWD